MGRLRDSNPARSNRKPLLYHDHLNIFKVKIVQLSWLNWQSPSRVTLETEARLKGFLQAESSTLALKAQ